MGLYAFIVTFTAVCAALAALKWADAYKWPAFALLISAVFARFAEWGSINPDVVMIAASLICIYVSLKCNNKLARAIATLYGLRLLLFTGPTFKLYETSIMWELSNFIVLLQAAILIGGVLHVRGNPIRFRGFGNDRNRAVNCRGGVADVEARRTVHGPSGRNV